MFGIANGKVGCPPNTLKNIKDQIEEFCEKLYRGFAPSGNYQIIEDASLKTVTLHDNESYVVFTLEKNQIKVRGWCLTFSSKARGTGRTEFDKVSLGSFSGYQEACLKGFLLFMEQKCGDVWVDNF